MLIGFPPTMKELNELLKQLHMGILQQNFTDKQFYEKDS